MDACYIFSSLCPFFLLIHFLYKPSQVKSLDQCFYEFWKKKKIPYSTFTCFHLLHICFGFPVVEAMEGGVDSLLISTSKFLFQRCCLFLKSSSVQTLLHSWNPDAAFISGSGKTFTMQPLPLRAAEDLVRLLRQPVYHNQRFKLWLSFFEIYGGKLFDLLSERKLVFPCSNWFITFFFP
jgi:hypothetical protein